MKKDGLGAYDGDPYFLDFNTYSGMTVPITSGTYRECLDVALVRVRLAKKRGQPISYLIPNRQWEFESRGDAMSISDREGFLLIRKAENRTIL